MVPQMTGDLNTCSVIVLAWHWPDLGTTTVALSHTLHLWPLSTLWGSSHMFFDVEFWVHIWICCLVQYPPPPQHAHTWSFFQTTWPWHQTMLTEVHQKSHPQRRFKQLQCSEKVSYSTATSLEGIKINHKGLKNFFWKSETELTSSVLKKDPKHTRD